MTHSELVAELIMGIAWIIVKSAFVVFVIILLFLIAEWMEEYLIKQKR